MDTNQLKDFKAIRLTVASPDKIKQWSYGEVIKPETINYRTQRPEKDGLFDERIFGPEKDYECYCGKYRKIRFKGIICDKCGVEVTHSSVRRERMGHIELAVPCSHIWFIRGVPSRVGLLLGLSVRDLEKVVYFTGYIIISVDETARQSAIKEVQQEYKTARRQLLSKIKDGYPPSKKRLLRNLEERRDNILKTLEGIAPMKVLDEVEYLQLSQRFGHVFKAGIGAEVLRSICEKIDLEKLRRSLDRELEEATKSQAKRILQRLRLVKKFIEGNMRPEWMFLTHLPVIPPDLRPMVQLDGDRFATSDVNDLYRRVINRNNRLKRLLELKAPEIIVRNEKRMLQESVDALIDNSARKGKEVRASTGQKRVLKSLADMLKGKQGRFRQNLLGKRVDYSGRSVIVVGPELKLDECGLPKRMALEIFKHFVIHKLIYDRDVAPNIKAASRMIDDEESVVWDVLEEVIKDKYVLLNRAPTLHRLSVQAFKPVLIEGSAIRLHPLVCQAFNADFDGDQMAVHLPLSSHAQSEAASIMRSGINLLKPATGRPIVNPTNDIVLGIYWMTNISNKSKGEGQRFGDAPQAILAWQLDTIDIKAKIFIRPSQISEDTDPLTKKIAKLLEGSDKKEVETCAGRLLFNDVLPEHLPFYNQLLNKKRLQNVVADIIASTDREKVWKYLDSIKNLGFHMATASGISWGMLDLVTPQEKTQILNKAQKEVDKIVSHWRQGLLTERERKLKVIETWLEASDEIAEAVPRSLRKDGPIFSIFDSGSRGSWSQTTQMAGLKGLVINPASEIIELPVRSSFKEGFRVIEYFISTHGARKGTTDTALKTAVAGYLTRRLVDVAQDIIIHEQDCGDDEGITVWRKDAEDIGIKFSERILGRTIIDGLKINGKMVLKSGELISIETAEKIEKARGITKLQIRSPITCRTRFGLCQKCYGYDLGNNELVKIGEAVGIVTAQSIGEPGTQLTMRTFHAGGVASETDITQGLPRIEELFEVRTPREKSIISEVNGQIKSIEKKGGTKEITVIETDSDLKSPKEYVYSVSVNRGLLVKEKDLVIKGQPLSEGALDLRSLYQYAGREVVQRYIIQEVQRIYTSQGANINDKYIEVIVKKMFSRINILDPGGTDLLPGEVVEKDIFEMKNERASKKGKNPAKGKVLLLGITKVALSTDSLLSAASFQETARVLIAAATEGKVDPLRGLKENVIIGRLVPAGTGYRPIDLNLDYDESIKTETTKINKHVRVQS